MEKFIPYEKLSKKKQRALNAARRGSWNGVNPVTRKTQNPKAYNRKKTRLWNEDVQRRVFLYASAAEAPSPPVRALLTCAPAHPGAPR